MPGVHQRPRGFKVGRTYNDVLSDTFCLTERAMQTAIAHPYWIPHCPSPATNRTQCFILSSRLSLMTAPRLLQPDTKRGSVHSRLLCVGSARSSGARRCYVRICPLLIPCHGLNLLSVCLGQRAHPWDTFRCTVSYNYACDKIMWRPGTDDPWDIAHARSLANIVTASESIA